MQSQRKSSLIVACVSLVCLFGAGQAAADAVATSLAAANKLAVRSTVAVVEAHTVTLGAESGHKLTEAPKKAVGSGAHPNAAEQDALCAWAYSATRSGQGLTKQMPPLLSFLIARCATNAADRLMQK